MPYLPLEYVKNSGIKDDATDDDDDKEGAVCSRLKVRPLPAGVVALVSIDHHPTRPTRSQKRSQ